MDAFTGCRRNAGISVVGSSKSRRRFRSGRRVVVARRHGGWVEGRGGAVAYPGTMSVREFNHNFDIERVGHGFFLLLHLLPSA